MSWSSGAPEAGTYTFSTENSAFTTQLGVLDGCGGAELACASSDETVFGGAALTLPLAADQTVFKRQAPVSEA